MPDIREVLAALDDEDKRLWSLHRTEMRRSYMAAHNSVIGVVAWDAHDDAFIDLIDIKLALLFDKSGRFNTVKEIAGKSDAEVIEGLLHKANDNLKLDIPKDTTVVTKITSSATAMMLNAGWADSLVTN